MVGYPLYKPYLPVLDMNNKKIFELRFSRYLAVNIQSLFSLDQGKGDVVNAHLGRDGHQLFRICSSPCADTTAVTFQTCIIPKCGKTSRR